jgi:hypothetical protein
MKTTIGDNMLVEFNNQQPLKGQLAFYKNKVWKVSDIHGNSIMHLQRPKHREAVSLFGSQMRIVKTVLSISFSESLQ